MTFPPDVLARAAAVELVTFDVDGVLTDGRLIYADLGTAVRELKAFHVHDGAAIKRLQQSGITVAFITGRSSPVVAHRASELGVAHVYQGQADKVAAFTDLTGRLSLPPDKVAHVGDDLPDVPLFGLVGLSISVPNGHPGARRAADFVTETPGGAGVAREVCELLLEARSGPAKPRS